MFSDRFMKQSRLQYRHRVQLDSEKRDTAVFSSTVDCEAAKYCNPVPTAGPQCFAVDSKGKKSVPSVASLPGCKITSRHGMFSDVPLLKQPLQWKLQPHKCHTSLAVNNRDPRDFQSPAYSSPVKKFTMVSLKPVSNNSKMIKDARELHLSKQTASSTDSVSSTLKNCERSSSLDAHSNVVKLHANSCDLQRFSQKKVSDV